MSFALATSGHPAMFLLKRSQIHGRLDAQYNLALLTVRLPTKYPLSTIRDIASSRTGGTPSKLVHDYWNGEIPWASPKDFTSFYLNDTEDHISEKAVSESATSVVPPGCLLIVFRSGILQHSLPVMVTTKRTAINQDIKALTLRAGIRAEYLGAYFCLFGRRLLPLVTKSGATVQSINTEQFDRLEIPVPTPDVQDRIVTLWSSAIHRHREGLSSAQDVLAGIDALLLRELGFGTDAHGLSEEDSRIFYAKLSQTTGQRLDAHFHRPEFEDLADALRAREHLILGDAVTLSHELWDQESIFDREFPYLEIGDLNSENGRFDKVRMKLIGEAPSRAQMLVRPADLLVSLTRPTRRAIAFPPPNLEIAVASNGFAIIRDIDRNRLTPRYLFHVLRSSLCTAQFDQRSTGGNYPAITEEELLNILIPLPMERTPNEVAEALDREYEKAEAMFVNAEQTLQTAKDEIELLILGQNGHL